MSLRLNIEKKLSQRSERVKCVDIHPTEPWVLACMHDGNVVIYDYQTGTAVKTFDVIDQPVRCGVFVPRKQWIIVGADDMYIRCYNYNTLQEVKIFEAHIDYIRSVAVHPTLPILLSCSDDMLVKAWNWEKGWECTMLFEGHSHYVMQVKFNPKNPNTFASASLDHTVKVWNLNSPVPNFTLEGHEKGVNCVDYYNGRDKPYLVTGGDDKCVRIWDYQTKACVVTCERHSHNVSCVAFLPDCPLIMSGSEDGTVLLWHSNTYRLEQTLNFAFDRCWSIAYLKGSNKVALGFDEGTVLVQMGKNTPVAFEGVYPQPADNGSTATRNNWELLLQGIEVQSGLKLWNPAADRDLREATATHALDKLDISGESASNQVPNVPRGKRPRTRDTHADSAAMQGVTDSNRRKYDVFISHAGPDKLAMAKPIFEALSLHNVHSFLDMEDLQINDCTGPEAMERAMGEAHVGIFVLSPEFASRKWTLRELGHFLERDEKCRVDGQPRPVLLPIFFRLGLGECTHAEAEIYGENSKYREVLRGNGFFRAERQVECSTAAATEALKGVTRYSGVEVSRIGGGEERSSAAVMTETVRRVIGYMRDTVSVRHYNGGIRQQTMTIDDLLLNERRSGLMLRNGRLKGLRSCQLASSWPSLQARVVGLFYPRVDMVSGPGIVDQIA